MGRSSSSRTFEFGGGYTSPGRRSSRAGGVTPVRGAIPDHAGNYRSSYGNDQDAWLTNSCNRVGGVMEETSWRMKHVEGILEDKSWMENPEEKS